MTKYVQLIDPTASFTVFDQKDETGGILCITGNKIWKVENSSILQQGFYFKAIKEADEKEYLAQAAAKAKEVKAEAKDTDATEKVEKADKKAKA